MSKFPGKISNMLPSMLVGFIYNFQVEWYNVCQDALNNVERLYQGKDTTDIIQSKVLQVYSLLSVCVCVCGYYVYQ
jgi:hypothetical protein